MMASKTVDQLTEAAAAATAKAAAAADAAEQARAEEQARRRERFAAIDRQWLDAYDPQTLHRAVGDARRQMVAAVRDDPTWAAVVGFLAAQYRHYQWHHQAAAVRDRLGLEPVAEQGPHPVWPISFDALSQIADQTAAGIVSDERDAQEAAREAAGDGP